MKFNLLLPAAILAALFAGTTAHGFDSKVIGPGDCQPYGQSSTYDTLAIRADGVQNKTTNTNKYTICPVNRDGDTSWTVDAGLTTFVYFVYAGNGTIQCTRTIGTDLANLLGVPPTSETRGIDDFSGSVKVIYFEEAAGESYMPATITCRLPPLAKLSMITTSENVATDSPPSP